VRRSSALHPSFSSRQEIVTRFFNEARAATAISDPGIVQVPDFGQHTDGSAYIVMELLEGETLDRRLRRQGPFAIGEALRLMRQVASSLGAAHAHVHRDLKPENLFVVRESEVAGGERTKIHDLGTAKLASDDGVKTQTSERRRSCRPRNAGAQVRSKRKEPPAPPPAEPPGAPWSLPGTYEQLADEMPAPPADTLMAPATVMTELNTAGLDGNGMLSDDGLTLYFQRHGIFVATRKSHTAAVGALVRLDELGAGIDATDPWISADQRTLIFCSNRAGNDDIHIATR